VILFRVKVAQLHLVAMELCKVCHKRFTRLATHLARVESCKMGYTKLSKAHAALQITAPELKTPNRIQYRLMSSSTPQDTLVSKEIF
jgi:hypothetical protein